MFWSRLSLKIALCCAVGFLSIDRCMGQSVEQLKSQLLDLQMELDGTKDGSAEAARVTQDIARIRQQISEEETKSQPVTAGAIGNALLKWKKGTLGQPVPYANETFDEKEKALLAIPKTILMDENQNELDVKKIEFKSRFGELQNATKEINKRYKNLDNIDEISIDSTLLNDQKNLFFYQAMREFGGNDADLSVKLIEESFLPLIQSDPNMVTTLNAVVKRMKIKDNPAMISRAKIDEIVGVVEQHVASSLRTKQNFTKKKQEQKLSNNDIAAGSGVKAGRVLRNNQSKSPVKKPSNTQQRSTPPSSAALQSVLPVGQRSGPASLQTKENTTKNSPKVTALNNQLAQQQSTSQQVPYTSASKNPGFFSKQWNILSTPPKTKK